MEQVLPILLLALAIALFVVLIRMHARLPQFDLPDLAADCAPPRHSEHGVTIPVRLATALVTLVILLKMSELAQQSQTALIWGGMLVPVLAYLNAYCWQFRAVLEGSDLSVMTPWFRLDTHDLTRLIALEEDTPGTYRLRFQDGTSAWLLKYVNGHDTLRHALDEAQPYY